jgi:hypothetical protein
MVVSSLEGDLFNTIPYKEVPTREIVEAEMHLTGKKVYKAMRGKFDEYTNLIVLYASLTSFNRQTGKIYLAHKKSPSTVVLSPEIVSAYAGIVYGLTEELNKLKKSFDPGKISKKKLESLIGSSKNFKVEEVIQTIRKIQKYINKSLPRMMFNGKTFKNLAYERVREVIAYLIKNPQEIDERIKNVEKNRIIRATSEYLKNKNVTSF